MDISEAPSSRTPATPHEDDGEKEELRMPSPPVDWAFNNLLLNVANGMTPTDLQEAKTIFKGQDGIGQRSLEKIKTPLELFDALQQRTFVDRNNLLFLQAMLYHLGRMDLLDLAVEYAHSLGNVIHFKSPPNQPANGYQFVQFHVEGTDFRKYTRRSLESMRTTAATLMFVPRRFVIIAGIEPSSSLLITLMIPMRFVKYFELALKKETTLMELTDLGVDNVRINESTTNLHGVEGADIVETAEQANVKSVYEKLQDTQRRLEDNETECLELKRKLREKVINGCSDQFKAALVSLCYDAILKQKVPKLSRQSAFAFFKFSYDRVQKLGYNTEDVAFLLDAHACFVSVRIQDSRDNVFKALLLENQELRAQLTDMQYRNIRPPSKAVVSIITDFQERLLDRLQSSLLANLSIPVPKRVVQFNPYTLYILKELSDMLDAKERQQLLSSYTWQEGDELTAGIRNKDRVFLVELYCKELQVTGKDIDYKEFVQQKLKEVSRVDLEKKFAQMLSSQSEYTNVPSAEGYTPSQQTQSATQASSLKSHIDEKVDLLLKRIQLLENKIQDPRPRKIPTLDTDPFWHFIGNRSLYHSNDR